MAGNLNKDSTRYLDHMKSKVAYHPKHPIHHGVKMQAHHLISQKGTSLLGKIHQNKLVEFDYNINVLDNLVFIPSTLQGACHLGVQPHRGNHTAKGETDSLRKSRTNDLDDDDGPHPKSYHQIVAKMVLAVARELELKCAKDHPHFKSLLKMEMNFISKKILESIQNRPRMVKLTDISPYFSPGIPAGCCGVDKLEAHRARTVLQSFSCPVDRNHELNQGNTQNKEEIKFPKKSTPYKLEAGN